MTRSSAIELVLLLYIIGVSSAQTTATDGSLVNSEDYRVSIVTFNSEQRPPEALLPLHCQVSPTPVNTTLRYKWMATSGENVGSNKYSPYAGYFPSFNHPRLNTIFCTVETLTRQPVGTAHFRFEVEGYVTAVGRTVVRLDTPHPLVLETTTSIQYTRNDINSPLSDNVMLFTRWEHNGSIISPEMTQYSGVRTLVISNTRQSNAGLYRYVVSHFIITTPVPTMETSTAATTVRRYSEDTADLTRQCSGKILDAMGRHAMFSPVEYLVYNGNRAPEVRQGPNAKELEFHVNHTVSVSVAATLQSIRCFQYRSLMDNDQLTTTLLVNGKQKFRMTGNSYTALAHHSQYEFVDPTTVNITLTLNSPKASSVGTFEYLFHISSQLLIKELNSSRCDESYISFVRDKIRSPYFLVGNAIIQVKEADDLIVNSTKMGTSTDKGAILLCTVLRPKANNPVELNWFKNGQLVGYTTAPQLNLDTGNLANKYGSFTCTSRDRDGQESSKNIHIAERASFSVQLSSRGSIDCDATTRNEDTAKAEIQNELVMVISQACNCEITNKELITGDLTCEVKTLTLHYELVYSDREGAITASNLLSSASTRLMGMRVIAGEPLVISTLCPLRDNLNNCIQGRGSQPLSGQLSMLSIALLVVLAIVLIVMTSIIIILWCVLKRRQTSTKFQSDQSPIPRYNESPQAAMATTREEPRSTTPQLSDNPVPYSYPQVHSIVPVRGIASINTRTVSATNVRLASVTGNSEHTHYNGANNTQGGQDEYTSNPAYMRNNTNPAYLSSNNERAQRDYQSLTSPSGGTREHVYDYPQFGSTEHSSTSTSSSGYI